MFAESVKTHCKRLSTHIVLYIIYKVGFKYCTYLFIMDSKSTEKDISSWDLWTGDTVHIGDLWKKEFDLSKLYGFMGHSRYCYLCEQISKPLYKRKYTKNRVS